MLKVEKGQLIKVGTAGETTEGMVIDVDDQVISIAEKNKVVQVARDKIESVSPYSPPSTAGRTASMIIAFVGVFGLGVEIGWAIFGGV